MPTENVTRKMKYIIGDVRKLSEMLRVSGKISQQAIKPITIRMTSITISELMKLYLLSAAHFTYIGDNWKGLALELFFRWTDLYSFDLYVHHGVVFFWKDTLST